ncbi:MAG TPA: ankyrin repeat domain-containing protein [Polyangiaceae bacterium]|nr:ankyrin repeat domain-containing protein [Polyangiaceae bacterium]
MSNMPSDRGMDAELLRAARRGDLRGVLLALDDGASVRAADDKGNALAAVGGSRKRKVMAVLVRKGASPDQTNPAGQTPLMQAAVRGDVGYARALLAVGANPNLVNDQSETALTFAVVWRQAGVVALLLRSGAKADKPIRPWTPLMYAAQAGDVRIARQLLKAGARPNRTDSYGRTASDIAKAHGHHAFLAMLERKLLLTARRS